MVTQTPSSRRKSLPRRASVVIVGAGFGGLYCAKHLARENVYVTIIDRRNFHLFQPLLYQVATGSLSSGEIASPVRTEFAHHDNVTVLQAEVTGFDTSRRQVIVRDGEAILYDYLVLATGSHHHYFGRDDWAKLAPGLKTVEDAMVMRSRILGAFEQAELLADQPERVAAALTFVIVGGGPTGVELAGTIGDLARSTMRGEFRRINTQEARVLLVENDNRVLPGFSEKSSHKAGEFLKQKGVSLMLNKKVTDVTEHDVELSGDDGKIRIPCHTVLWAAGNKASPLGRVLAEQCSVETDRAGRIAVTDRINVPGWNEIFVIGDLASCNGKDGRPLPGVAPVAMQQGKYVAKSIVRREKDQQVQSFEYFNKGSLAVVGRNRAVAEFGKMRLAGWFAWILWAGVHISYLVEFQNRLVVLTRWAVGYITSKRGARLITGDEGPVGASGNQDAAKLNRQDLEERQGQPPPTAPTAPDSAATIGTSSQPESAAGG